jgi:tetraacyldisaccharide 4'-kinase
MSRPNGYRSSLPVICIGNFTAGGTGKTPFAIALASIIKQAGRSPWFLSRGYGGSAPGPVRVDGATHDAAEVGDEPLLLARHAPTLVARDRRQGAEAIEKVAPSDALIIMDDGLQNPAIAKDLSIAVIDGSRGIGNGRVIPSGPLRAPLLTQLDVVDAVVVMGGGELAPGIGQALSSRRIPVLTAQTSAASDNAALAGKRLFAYAGIANPERFFSMISKLGGNIVARRVFPDHHAFSDSDATRLLDDAASLDATLVATEKDLVRLARSSPQEALRQASTVLAIETAVNSADMAVLKELLARALTR